MLLRLQTIYAGEIFFDFSALKIIKKFSVIFSPCPQLKCVYGKSLTAAKNRVVALFHQKSAKTNFPSIYAKDYVVSVEVNMCNINFVYIFPPEYNRYIYDEL